MEVNLKAVQVQPNYLIKKQLFFAELQRRNDSLIISNLQEKLQLQDRKIDEQKDLITKQTQDMKLAFRQNIGGLVEAVTGQIKRQFQANSKKYKLEQDEKDQGLQDQEKRRLLKRLKKRIKKQKKSKKRSKKSKKKEKKRKKKQIKELKRLIEGDRKQKSSQDRDHRHNNGHQHKNPAHDKNHHEEINIDDDANDISLIRALDRDLTITNINGKDGIWGPEDIIRHQLEQRHKKLKESKSNEKGKSKVREQGLVKPKATEIFGMTKLRNKGNQQEKEQKPQNIDLQNSSEVELYIPKRQQSKGKANQKDSKDKKGKKQKKDKKQRKQKNKPERVVHYQNIQQQNEAEYQKKLEQYRKTGDIEAVRLGRINRIKAAMKAPAVLQYDQFNPNYKGQPKYKPFVKLNEFQPIRPGQIFAGRLDEPPPETKRIPAIFRGQIPSFKSYQVNGNVIRKIKGTNYQQMVFDYPIPVNGKHIVTMRIIESKRFYIWFGVIDFRQKDREQSYNKNNCIAFSFKTGHIVTNNKWSRSKIGCLEVGMAVRMQIDMDKSSISWFVSDGRNNIATINKLLKRLVLVPYVQIMDNDDEICFED